MHKIPARNAENKSLDTFRAFFNVYDLKIPTYLFQQFVFSISYCKLIIYGVLIDASSPIHTSKSTKSCGVFLCC